MELRITENDIKKMTPPELACLLHNCVYPSLSKKPIYNDPDLWVAVDSAEFNKWLNGAQCFIRAILSA